MQPVNIKFAQTTRYEFEALRTGNENISMHDQVQLYTLSIHLIKSINKCKLAKYLFI